MIEYNKKPTASQTIGPFFHSALLPNDPLEPVRRAEPTNAGSILITGQVYDGEGNGVADALLEFWQANAYGRYNHPLDTRTLPLDNAFTGFGRIGTDQAGHFQFATTKPGPTPFEATTLQAPHISLMIAGRGLLNQLYTRIYFADEQANAHDPILQCVPESRRTTLIATRKADQTLPTYCFDIVLQGLGETLFFTFTPGGKSANSIRASNSVCRP